MTPSRAPTFLVVFKTHAWDPFIARQLDRLKAQCRTGRVVVVADETSGALGPIPHPDVIRTTNAELLSLGLADAFGKGGLLWWNTDYPNYLVAERLPAHDFYVFVEYDCCVRRDLDALVAELAADSVDLLTQPTRQDKASWYWTRFHEAVYPYDDIRGSLNCFCVLSQRALRLLFERRRHHAAEHAAGRLGFWPGNEVFIATEAARAGLTVAPLDSYGSADRYEWHPPILEDDLDDTAGTFLHPVLDRGRYIASVLKFTFDLSSYFDRRSPLRRDLARFPARDYVPLMPAAFRRQLATKLRQAMGSI